MSKRINGKSKSSKDEKHTLREIVSDSTPEFLVGFFDDMPEAKRQFYADEAETLFEHAHSARTSLPKELCYDNLDFMNSVAGLSPLQKRERIENRLHEFRQCCRIVALAALPLPTLKSLNNLRIFDSLDLDVLSHRDKGFANEILTYLYDKKQIAYPICFELLLKYEIDRELDDEFIQYFAELFPYYNRPLLECISKNIDLYRPVLLKFFDISPIIFTGNHVAVSHHWEDIFAKLVEQNDLDGEQIARLSFEMIKRHLFIENVTWPCKVHAKMIRKPNDTIPFFDTYLQWAEASDDKVAGFAFDMLLIACKNEKRLDDQLITVIDRAMRGGNKGRTQKAIQILKTILKRSGHLREQVSELLVMGLEHESTDIQAAALKVLRDGKRLEDGSVLQKIKQLADTLSPSVRVELNLDAPRSERPERIVPAISPVQKQTTPEPLPAIQSLDDLFDLAARIIEIGGTAEEGEQMLDGISRLCLERPANWDIRTKQILKRLEHVYNSFPPFGRDLFFPMLDVISTWLGQSRSKSAKSRYAILRNPLKPDWIFQNRCNDIAANIRNGISSQILSFPSHHGYGISAAALLERVRQNRDRFDAVFIFDQIQSLFRLMPGDRGTLLASLDERDFAPTKNGSASYGHFYHVLKYVCGGPEIPEDVPSDYRDVGIQIRSLYDSVPSYEFCIRETPQGVWRRKGKMLSAKATESDKIPGLRIWNSLNIPTHTESRQLANEHLAAICPHNMEPYYAHGCIVLGMDVDTKSRMNENAVFLNALLASHNSLSSAGTALILIALASQAPPVQQCGIDAWIGSVNTGRIEPKMLKKIFASLLPLEVFKPIRWTKTLAVCAAESGLHAGFVHQLIEETLMHVPSKELTAFLALLLELSLSTHRKITSPSARRFLETASGKTATVAKKLLEL